MGAHQNVGGASAFPSAALLESAIRRLSRSELADLCEQLIDRMDRLDPDPDLEPDGDELDGSDAEDDYQPASDGNRPGCPISDPPEDDDQDYCLASEDRGSSGPNARFPGHVPHKEYEADPDCERWHQPVELN